MKPIPKILHMIWVGVNSAPDYFFENLAAWKQLMPDWEFKIWTNADLTVTNIDKEYLDLINKADTGAQKADLLRYYVVNKFGGYYVDSDITPQRSLNELDTNTHNIVLCHDLKIDWAYIINAFFAASPKHPILEFVIQQMYNVDYNNSEIHLTTGPAALGKAYFNFKNNLNCLILPYWFFYRNKKGDLDINGIPLTEDKIGAFGSHRYAATWVKKRK